jgi:hypothetical protein
LEFVKKNETIDDKWLQKARKLYTNALKKGYHSINSKEKNFQNTDITKIHIFISK